MSCPRIADTGMTVIDSGDKQRQKISGRTSIRRRDNGR